MELPYPLSLQEAQKKLHDTYLVVNDVLVYVKEISETSIRGFDNTYQDKLYVGDAVNSINAFLPDSGVYEVPKCGIIFLTKIPRKQWKKSFSTDFYSISGENAGDAIFKIYSCNLSPVNFYISKNHLWYLKKKIGDVVAQTIHLKDDDYRQELIDLTKRTPKWRKYNLELKKFLPTENLNLTSVLRELSL